MRRRVLIILFFTVVFGFPVTWYLILQVFGENQFELPVLRVIDRTCVESPDAQAVLIINDHQLSQSANLSKRIYRKLGSIRTKTNMSFDSSCLGQHEIVFVDSVGQVRGEFMLNREDIDRLFAEMDIYALNIERNRNGR